MSARSKATISRRKNLVKAHQATRKNPKMLDARQLAFSILVTGSQPGKIEEALLWNDIELPPLKELNAAMHEVCDRIISMAEHSMQRIRDSINSEIVISFDGSWEHRRNSSRCLFTVIEQKSKQVLDCVVISRKVPKDDPTFCLQPNQMEAKGLSRIIERLKGNKWITAYVHDNDAKARSMIRKAKWNIREILDSGHCFKAFERKFQKLKAGHKGIFDDIEEPLKKWLRTVIKSGRDPATKGKMWTDCIHHLMGDHRLCDHGSKEYPVWRYSDNTKAVELLKEFLEKTKFICETVSHDYTTQSNESFHLLKLRYATKDIKWGFTWGARMRCAVLDRNWPHWKEFLYDWMGLPPLNGVIRTKLRRDEEERLRRREFVRSEEYIRQQFEWRKNWKDRLKALMRDEDPAGKKLAYKRNPYKRK